MRAMAMAAGFIGWLIPWLPFALCGIAVSRDFTDCRQIQKRALLCVLLPLCFWLPFCMFRAAGFVILMSMLALMLLSMPAYAKCLGLPVGYISYCLLIGVFASVMVAAFALDDKLSGTAFSGGAALALRLLFSCFCGGICVLCLKKLVFPYRKQIASVKRLLFDASGLIYLAIMLFFYCGGMALLPSEYAVIAKLFCYLFCFFGLRDTYRRNGRLLKAMVEAFNQQNRAELLEHGLQLQQDRYAAMVEQAEAARVLRHDLRHHEMLMNQYICSGNKDRLAEYIEEFRRQQRLFDQEPSICAHPVADALARYYLGQMKKEGALLDVILEISEQYTVPGADLCVVLGNCLENALEAIRQADDVQRYFRMRAIQNGPMLTIVAENGYSGERLRDGAGFLSTKRAGRGIGLDSMASIAERYGGNFRAEARNGAFRVSVVLFGKEE